MSDCIFVEVNMITISYEPFFYDRTFNCKSQTTKETNNKKIQDVHFHEVRSFLRTVIVCSGQTWQISAPLASEENSSAGRLHEIPGERYCFQQIFINTVSKERENKAHSCTT